jgi:hypothetical protein
MALHIIKLCVGVDSVDELRAWRTEQRRSGRDAIVHTRQSPKRCDEVLEGGSLYLGDQGRGALPPGDRVRRTLEDGPKTRCEIRLCDEVVLTEPAPRRAFQGLALPRSGRSAAGPRPRDRG